MPVRSTVLESATAGVFEALAHPLRIRMVKALLAQGYCQCDLAAKFQEHPVSISRHLAVLARAGLVLVRKEGTKTFPELVYPRIGEVLKIAESFVHRAAAYKVKEAASHRAALSE